MRPLDFLIIGAQKSGTTTLFQLLSEHPQVFVPEGKELPFFNKGQVTPESYAVFFQEHFADQPDDVLIGKVTPHYLPDPRVPDRLDAVLPTTRLIAILRDPVERAFSHYRMSVRRKLETRGFDAAVDELLEPDELEAARLLPSGRESETRTYVVWGEYGRLLEPYADRLDNGTMLVLSTRELEQEPDVLMRRLCKFLGIDMVDLPSLGMKLHQGGDKERLPIERIAKAIAPIRWMWSKLPHRYRSRLMFRIGQWNVVKSEQGLEDLPQVLTARLRSHFAADAQAIEKLTGWRPDWLK